MELHIGWVDGCLLAVLALSVLIGLMRGLVFELLSLGGWVVAYFVALWGAPLVAPHLPVGAPGSTLNGGLAFACAFLAALVVWSLLARWVRRLLHATPLRPIDRTLGALFGFLRGSALLLLAVLLLGFTPAAESPAWRSSTGVAWLGSVLQELKPLLPARPPVRSATSA